MVEIVRDPEPHTLIQVMDMAEVEWTLNPKP
jgi:hypothetical protein